MYNNRSSHLKKQATCCLCHESGCVFHILFATKLRGQRGCEEKKGYYASSRRQEHKNRATAGVCLPWRKLNRVSGRFIF